MRSDVLQDLALARSFLGIGLLTLTATAPLAACDTPPADSVESQQSSAPTGSPKSQPVAPADSVETQTSALVGTHTLKVKRDSIISSSASCDNRLTTVDGDWFVGVCKTECGSAIAGIASTGRVPNYSGQAEWTDMIGCADWLTPANVSTKYNSPSAYTLHSKYADDRRTPNVGYDWADGLVKAECDNGSAITGIAT